MRFSLFKIVFMLLNIDWHELLFGNEDWNYLLNVAIKTIVMFVVVLVSLRLIGRRGIMQGVFQVLTIIMLGSSAGDPMLYREVGLLTASLVFIVIILLYRLTSAIIGKHYLAEKIVEGKPVRFIKDNRFDMEHFRTKELDKDELFADLRKENVSHIGQVKAAYIEPAGEISVFFRPDSEVIFGLPILPEAYEHHVIQIPKETYYSCAFCGNTEKLAPQKEHKCPMCEKNKWVESSDEKRIK
jgi:uncharacterized membrane protein YcaP (DUF421 family)